MPIPTVTLKISDSLKSLDQDFQKLNRTIYDDEALDLADELQRNSPVGATGDLRRGWDVLPARRQIGSIRVVVTNKADAAYFRIVGRGPGKMPPEGPIDQWVQAKQSGLSQSERRSRVFLIRRKIAREGTDRFQSKQNILGIEPGDDVSKSPLIQDTKKRIVDRVNQIQLPRRRGRRR